MRNIFSENCPKFRQVPAQSEVKNVYRISVLSGAKLFFQGAHISRAGPDASRYYFRNVLPLQCGKTDGVWTPNHPKQNSSQSYMFYMTQRTFSFNRSNCTYFHKQKQNFNNPFRCTLFRHYVPPSVPAADWCIPLERSVRISNQR